MNRIVGKCGKCGGVVSVPHLWWGVGRPPATCEACGAYADESANLPVLPMRDIKTTNRMEFK